MAWVNATDLFTLAQLVDLPTTFGVSVQDGFIVGNNAWVNNQLNSSLLNLGAALGASFPSVKGVKYNIVYWREKLGPGVNFPTLSAPANFSFPTGLPADIRENLAAQTGGFPSLKLANEFIPSYGESFDKSGGPFVGFSIGFARTSQLAVQPGTLTDFKLQIFFYIEPPVPAEPEAKVIKNDPVPTMGTPGVISAAFICEE